MDSPEPIYDASQFTSVENYDPKVKSQAYDLFLHSENDFSDIGLALGISSKVVASWARKGKWKDRKIAIEDELMIASDAKYRALVRENRIPVLRRHLEATEILENGIIDVLKNETGDGNPNPMNLKRMAEALTSSANVSARAAGITETPNADTRKDSDKRPLIMIGVVPTPLAGGVDAAPIEVTVTETEV